MNTFPELFQSDKKSIRYRKAFSLIEVVLAMGIFLITVLTLVGLMGPALKSVSTVKTTDEVVSVVDSVNAFLNSSPFIPKPAAGGNPKGTKFDAIYGAVQNDGHATIFVYRWYDAANQIVRQEIGFENNQGGSVHSQSVVNANNRGDGVPVASFDDATSLIYRVVLTASSAMLVDDLVNEGTEGAYPRYTLSNTVSSYSGNYLALEVRIFAEDPTADPPSTNTADLADEVPVLVYDTAILR